MVDQYTGRGLRNTIDKGPIIIHEFCNRGGCYVDHGEWNCAPLRRCLKCDELIHPDNFGSVCNPPAREPVTPGYFYADYIPLIRNYPYSTLKDKLKDSDKQND